MDGFCKEGFQQLVLVRDEKMDGVRCHDTAKGYNLSKTKQKNIPPSIPSMKIFKVTHQTCY